MRILKYPLPHLENKIKLPANSFLLDVQLQGEVATLWVETRVSNKPDVEYTITLIPTGETVQGYPGRYRATVQYPNGIVMHVYVKHQDERS